MEEIKGFFRFLCVVQVQGPVQFRRRQGIDAHRIGIHVRNGVKPTHVGVQILGKLGKVFARFRQTHINAPHEEFLPEAILVLHLETLAKGPYPELWLSDAALGFSLGSPGFDRILQNFLHQRNVGFPEEIVVVIHRIVGQHSLNPAYALNAKGGCRLVDFGKIPGEIPARILSIPAYIRSGESGGQPPGFEFSLAFGGEIEFELSDHFGSRLGICPLKPVPVGDRVFQLELALPFVLERKAHTLHAHIPAQAEHLNLILVRKDHITPAEKVPWGLVLLLIAFNHPCRYLVAHRKVDKVASYPSCPLHS